MFVMACCSGASEGHYFSMLICMLLVKTQSGLPEQEGAGK